MFRIIVHIERLLLVHDCVIVPKFGGFVLQTVSASCSAGEHTFRPLRKEISFNTTLQHNDGLLPESYMQMYNVNYRKAQLMLEEDIESLKTSLQQGEKLLLGVLGSFCIGNEGQLIFYPGKTDLFSVGSYGLPIFHFPVLSPLQSVQEENVHLLASNKKREKDIFYIPISRKLIRAVVASAAAIALFLLVSTPVKDVNQAAYKASFIPTEMITYAATPALESENEISVEPFFSEIEEVKVSEVTVSVPVIEAQIATPPSSAKEKRNARLYHIVIASFPSETKADDYLSGVDRDLCKNVSKFVRDGKYRIYADKFDNREDAESYMQTLRGNQKYKDAWLFISR